MGQANASAGYPLWIVRNAGVSGDTTADMAARVAAVMAHDPAVVPVLGGTNDAAAGRGSAAVIADLIVIYDAIVAGDAIPIAFTIPPRTGISDPAEQETISGTNTWLRDNFLTLYPTGKLCDWFATFSEDGTVFNPIDALFSDNVHFNAAGATAGAADLDDILATL